MPNIASLLKAEITRLARKELRAETASLQKASAQYRRDIAALKRQVALLERSLRAATKGKAKTSPAEDASEPSASRRFRAAGFAAHRERLALSAAEMGRLVGVSGQTIYKWEQGKSRPRASQLDAIAAARSLGKREATARLEQLGDL